MNSKKIKNQNLVSRIKWIIFYKNKRINQNLIIPKILKIRFKNNKNPDKFQKFLLDRILSRDMKKITEQPKKFGIQDTIQDFLRIQKAHHQNKKIQSLARK